MTGSVLTVAGCKGGVGKTTTAVNLGTAAEIVDIDVMLIETDLAMASVCDFLDLDFDPRSTPPSTTSSRPRRRSRTRSTSRNRECACCPAGRR